MAKTRRKPGNKARGIIYLMVVALFGVGYYVRDQRESGATVSLESLPEITTPGFEVLTGCRVVSAGGNDGDSFRVRHGGDEMTFRLYFVDAPETSASWPERIRYQSEYFGGLDTDDTLLIGKDAKAFTLDLLDSKPFAIVTRWENVMKSERYHAFVLVETAPGKSEYLSSLLVERGLARIYTMPADLPDGTPKNDFKATLKDLEAKAKRENRGAWGLN